MSIVVIDVVCVLIIIALAINGAIKGFIAELLGKAAFIVGLLVGVLFYNWGASVLGQWLPVVFLAQIVSFLLLFIVTFLTIKILQHFLGNLFKGDILGSLNQALGFFLGLAEGVLIVAVLLLGLRIQPLFDAAPLLQGSFFDAFLADPLDQSMEFMTQGLSDV